MMVSINKRVLKPKLFFFISFLLFQVKMINYDGFTIFLHFISHLSYPLFPYLMIYPKKVGGESCMNVLA